MGSASGAGSRMNTSTKLAYLVVAVAVGISLYSVYTKQDLVQVAAPAVAWSQQQFASLSAKLPWPAAASSPIAGRGSGAATAVVPEEFEPAACQLHGTVVDCACSYGAVEKLNRDVLWPTLEQLVKTPFFRYFKVNLYCDCPLWPDNAPMCNSRDCCVSECEEHEIPAPWREEEDKRREVLQCGDDEGGLDRAVEGGMEAKLQAVRNWHGLNNPWVPEPAGGDVEYVYINLVANPEKYTGYKGEDARAIWGAIYQQSCFKGADKCKEKQVLNRLISGMHSSITTHVIENYFDEEKQVWGANMKLFKMKFANPEARRFVENMYFAYLFVLRAVVKVAPTLTNFDYNTGGVPEEDARTLELVKGLVGNERLQSACPSPFDEGLLWRGKQQQEVDELRAQLLEGFHNITQIMDCVGCEKCKMWGKLQTLGIATSLKILFENEHPDSLQLDRNEVIALVNTLGRFSESIETVRRLSLELQKTEGGRQAEAAAAAAGNGYGAIKDMVGGGKAAAAS